MKYRWTMKQLKEATDKWMLSTLITERRSELNPYAPLNERLKKINLDQIFKSLELLEVILKQRKLLPMLIGIDASLDEVIAERLKGE